MGDVGSYEQVANILRTTLEGVPFPAELRALLYIPLTQSGKTLSGRGRPRWPAMVLASAAAARGDGGAAAKVAAAVELFIAAADVFDELEDGDDSPLVKAAGTARALNAASAMLVLAQDLLNTLHEDGVPVERVPAFGRTLTRGALAAACGQDRDLAAEGQDLSAEGALDIARSKAGALGAAACRLGALTGTTDENLLALYEELGRHYGTMGQVSNDLHDAMDGTLAKSDRRRAKGTLPFVFARRTPGDPAAWEDAERLSPQRLHDMGALHFAYVVVETERQSALRLAEALSRRGQCVEPLFELLG